MITSLLPGRQHFQGQGDAPEAVAEGDAELGLVKLCQALLEQSDERAVIGILLLFEKLPGIIQETLEIWTHQVGNGFGDGCPLVN